MAGSACVLLFFVFFLSGTLQAEEASGEQKCSQPVGRGGGAGAGASREEGSGDAMGGGGGYAAAGDKGGGRVRGGSPCVGLRGLCAGARAPVARVRVGVWCESALWGGAMKVPEVGR